MFVYLSILLQRITKKMQKKNICKHNKTRHLLLQSSVKTDPKPKVAERDRSHAAKGSRESQCVWRAAAISTRRHAPTSRHAACLSAIVANRTSPWTRQSLWQFGSAAFYSTTIFPSLVWICGSPPFCRFSSTMNDTSTKF